MFYGAAVWDPWLILAQIITVQCLFYLSFGLLLYLFLGAFVVDAMQCLEQTSSCTHLDTKLMPAWPVNNLLSVQVPMSRTWPCRISLCRLASISTPSQGG